jgi:ribosomal protein S18 acetylase RimI-like enzyme
VKEDAGSRIRALKPEDFEAVVEIDKRTTGRSRRLFFEKRLEAALADRDGFVSVALEDGTGALVGFCIARVQSGEFGDDRRAVVLDVIGVDPESRNRRHGTRLLEALVEQARERGANELRTQVEWSNRELVQFFAATGFLLAPSQVLERPTARHL